MRSRHFIRVALACLAAAVPLVASAQPAAPAPEAREAQFIVFLRGAMVGTEEIAVTGDASGWRIISSGRLNAPLDIINRRVDLQYDTDWNPVQMTLDATIRGQQQSIRTTVSGTTASSELNIAGKPGVAALTTSARLFLPSLFFGPLEALGARLRTAQPGATITALAPPQTELTVVVGESASERIQTPRETLDARRTRVTITPQVDGAAAVEAELWADSEGRFLRLSIPVQGLEVLREDMASVSSRRVPISRPNDEQVRIPANGFVMAGTVSRPAGPAAERLPAVLLVGGNDQSDRDELVAGIPIFGQLAGALADAGFLVLRYDRRGVGLSGGRSEAATVTDYATDVRAAVRYLDDRRDVDDRRIIVAGYNEGGLISMLAAAREGRIAALVLLATPGTTGADMNLEQVKDSLDGTTKSAAEREETLALQRRIQQAVLTGEGWTEELVPFRRQADTPWFASYLAFDPVRVMRDVRQPVLIVHGELDREVPIVHADRLEALANQRRNRPPAQVVKVPGVNHLLAPAATGEADEYAVLKERRISDAVAPAIVRWLQTALPANR